MNGCRNYSSSSKQQYNATLHSLNRRGCAEERPAQTQSSEWTGSSSRSRLSSSQNELLCHYVMLSAHFNQSIRARCCTSGHATQRATPVNLTHPVTRVYRALRVKREVQILSRRPAVLLLLSPPPTLSLFISHTDTALPATPIEQLCTQRFRAPSV